MKNYLIAGTAALLLAGAGCNSTTPTAELPASKPAGEAAPVSTTTVTTVETVTPAVTDFTLTGEAKGNMMVNLNFTAPEEMTKDAQGFRLLMGRETDPTPETATDWYALGTAHRTKNWTVRATGQRHFRVCVMKTNACTAYSNDLELEVK